METVMNPLAAEQCRFKYLRQTELALHEKKSLVKLAGEVLASRYRRGAITNGRQHRCVVICHDHPSCYPTLEQSKELTPPLGIHA